ncbi:MAG: dynamin family protein [Pseudonocardia sp.]|nr:dynamin family protein [Pseudonocardia sp.]
MTLTDDVGAVLAAALEVYRGDTAHRLRGHLERLHEPLRVAIAGKVKSGKSTLLNALVGDRIAQTDAGECTRIVTWYRDGAQPTIVLHPRRGTPVALPVRRRGGRLVVDLEGHPADRVEKLVVEWPSPRLRATTLIDTPGMQSLSGDVARRSVTFLDPEDDTPSEADAVVYLMRHLHAADARFLEAFRDQGVAKAASVNAVGVISRADEIGGGRSDAMSSAAAVARRYRGEPALRGLCQNVVAVAGLIAETARTLRPDEFTAAAALAGVPPDRLDAALVTADRFGSADGPLATCDVPPDTRRAMLARFGVFGIRTAAALVRTGAVSDAPGLAAGLLQNSGLPELEFVLHQQFVQRRDVLKARSGLHALDGVLRAEPVPGAERLAVEVERLLTGAHEFVELRLLGALRSGAVALPAHLLPEAEQLLGAHGPEAPVRLGLHPQTDPAAVHAAAMTALGRWQSEAENPMSPRAATDACRVVVRSCEGIVTALRAG